MKYQEKNNVPAIEKQYEEEIDLLEILFAWLSHWKWIVLTAFLCGGIAGLYNHFLIKPDYRANAEIYITNTDTMISFQDVQLSAALTVDYEEILRSRRILKKVIDDQNLDLTYKELSDMITISNPEDSHCLKICVEFSEPDTCVNILNSLLKYGVDGIYRVVGNDEPVIIDSAEADAVEVIKPGLVRYTAMGALLGAVLVCFIITLQVVMDMTLKTEEDVQKYMSLPVLACVPVFDEKRPRYKKRGKSGK